ncbi:MAG: hypothetical protein II627_02280, partial [Lachnospiraceae bacterium]|nr:hypothetical protein [Lachnospiraceae bacterium]
MNSSFNPTSGRPKIRISVRGLVEFICRGGDIDNRISGASQLSAMEAGSRIHRKIQRQMGSTYNSEVPLRLLVERALFELVLEGRADGIYTIETKEYVEKVNKDHMSRVDKKRDSQESLLFQQDNPADPLFHEKQVLWNSEMNPQQGDLLGDDPASITLDAGISDCFQDDLSDIPSIHDTSEQPGTSTLGGISEQPGTSPLGGISEQPELQI